MERLKPPPRTTFPRALFAATLLLSLAAAYQVFWPVYNEGILFLSRRWMAFLALTGLAVLAEAGLLAAGSPPRLERLAGALQRLGKWNLALFGLLAAFYSFLVLGPFGAPLLEPLPRLLAFWLVALAGWVLLKATWPLRSWAEMLAAALVLAAAFYRVAVFLTDISQFPFSAGWSEASRFYYASLFFARQLYGLDLPPTVLHPTRYLLQSLPFLVPGSPLWVHRLWQILLWVVTTFATAILLARRLQIPASDRSTYRLRTAVFVAWTALFLLLGPVYYHLQVTVILVLWGFRPRAESRRGQVISWAFVLLASMWAGISRVNWFPVPGMLAAALYFLELPLTRPLSDSPDGDRQLEPLSQVAEAKPENEPSNLQLPASSRAPSPPLSPSPLWHAVRYLLPPAAGTLLGTLAAFGAQTSYAVLSGNPTNQFTSSFTSDLLWYRLLPNPTYPLGILPAALIVSAPLVLLAWWRLASGRLRGYRWHPLRLLGLGAILLVLFAGGLVVSVKIGGGNNLHNIDAYLTLLLVITAYIFFGQFEPEPQDEFSQPARLSEERSPALPIPRAPLLLLGLAVLMPLHAAVTLGGPVELPTPDSTQRALEILENQSHRAVQNGGEVLFISERQLLTFGILEGIPLVPEYERVFLMEMAMAGDPAYLEKFYSELREHRFALIVSEPLHTNLKGSREPFGEENDAWVKNISRYILCSYEPEKGHREVREVGVTILTPEENAGDCP